MKAEITTNKGTQTILLEVGLPNWSGELFNEYQEKKMASLPTTTILCLNNILCGQISSC